MRSTVGLLGETVLRIKTAGAKTAGNVHLMMEVSNDNKTFTSFANTALSDPLDNVIRRNS